MTITRRILIPLLIFISVVLIAVQAYTISQESAAASEQEARELANLGEFFQSRITSLESFATALAIEVASDPQVQEAFAAGDRERLIALTLPAYERLDAEYDIPQHQFHLPPATSFVRLHQLDRYGDDLSSFRNTVLAANENKEVVSGLEIGRAGLGIRGVAPVSYQGEHIGTVEFGLNVDQTLLESLKDQFGVDWQILLRQDASDVAIFEGAVAGASGPLPNLFLQASTLEEPAYAPEGAYTQALGGQAVFNDQAAQENFSVELYTLPIRDFSGEIIGVVEIVKDRSDLAAAQLNRSLLFVLSTLGILVVTGVGTNLVLRNSLRPISVLTQTAQAIANGDLDKRVPITSKDELGQLADAFNSMSTQLQELIGSLERRVQERTQALSTSADVSRQLSSLLDQDQLVREVVTQIQEAFGFYHTHIYLLDEETNRLVMAGGTGEAGEQLLAQDHAIEMGRGLVGRAAVTETAVFVPHVAQDPAWLPNPLLPETRAEAAVPIMLGNKVIGVLDVQHNKVGEIESSTVDMLQSIASQVAIALQNARQVQEAQESEARLRAVLESVTVPMLISRVSDGQMLYVNEHLANVVRMPLAEVQTSGTPNFYVNAADRQTVVGQIQQQGFVANYELLLRRADGNEFWALLSARLIQFAGQPSIITTLIDINDRKQAEATLARQAVQLQSVTEINTLALSLSRLEEMLPIVATQITENFNLYHAHIYLLDEDNQLKLAAGAGEVGQQMVQEGHTISLHKENSLVARAARTVQAVLVNDVAASPDYLPNPLLPETQAELAVPLLIGGQVLGVLDVQANQTDFFTETDINIQSTLANQLAASIQAIRAAEQAAESAARANALARRLTRTGWQEFAAHTNKRMAYGYKQQKTIDLLAEGSEDITAGATLVEPLALQGEKIGALALSEPQELASEARDIMTAVAERLSEHLENLRLTQQTQQALAQTETLYAGSAKIVQAASPEEVLAAITTSTAMRQLDRTSILYFDRPWDENPKEAIVRATWAKPGMQASVPAGTTFPLEQFPIMNFVERHKPTVLEDIANNDEIGENLRELFATLKINTMMGMPLVVGNRWFGLITAQSEKTIPGLAEDDIRQIRSLVEQAATVLRTQQLLEDIQNQANIEQTLREITARVYAAPTAEAVLRIAAREANRILGLETFAYVDAPTPTHDTGPLGRNGKQSNGHSDKRN